MREHISGLRVEPRSATSWNLLITGLLLITAAWIWLSKTSPGGTTNGAIPAPHQGFQAPDFSLQTLDNETLRLADLRGRPVLVNVWATWCPPCRSEMPAMQQIYQDYQDQGFVVLGVNATDQDSRSLVEEFVGQERLTFPILLDEAGAVSRNYLVRSLPTSFFIDPEGTIQEVVIGGPMSEALLRIRVENLLKAGAGEAP